MPWSTVQKHFVYILKLSVHTVQRIWIGRLGRYSMGGREWWEGGAVGRGRRVAQEGGVGRRRMREGWEGGTGGSGRRLL